MYHLLVDHFLNVRTTEEHLHVPACLSISAVHQIVVQNALLIKIAPVHWRVCAKNVLTPVQDRAELTLCAPCKITTRSVLVLLVSMEIRLSVANLNHLRLLRLQMKTLATLLHVEQTPNATTEFVPVWLSITEILTEDADQNAL